MIRPGAEAGFVARIFRQVGQRKEERGTTEGRDMCDAFAGELDHLERPGLVAGPVRTAPVLAEGGRAVRHGRDEP